MFPSTPLFGHAGEAYGLISDLYVDPPTGFGLVFITNGYTPGNNYQSGIGSAFYRPEELVYAALQQHSVPACASTGTPTRATETLLHIAGGRITWGGSSPAAIALLDTVGRLVEQFTLAPNSSRAVRNDVYVVRYSSALGSGAVMWSVQE